MASLLCRFTLCTIITSWTLVCLVSASAADVLKEPKLRATLGGGHSRGVYSIAFSPDGRLLASGSSDRTIVMWDVASGEEKRTLKGHTLTVQSLAFSPDGKWLASSQAPVGKDDKDKRDSLAIRLWHVLDGKEKALRFPNGSALSVAFSPDGKLLAWGDFEGTISICDVAKGEIVCAFKHPKRQMVCRAVAFSADGRWLAGRYSPDGVIIWDVARKKERQTLVTRDGNYAVVFHPDGKLAAGTYHVKLWDIKTAEATATFTGLGAWDMAFGPDGKLLALAEGGMGIEGGGRAPYAIRLFDVAGGKEIAYLKGRHNRPVFAVAFSPDGALLASGSLDRTIKLWKVPVAGEKDK